MNFCTKLFLLFGFLLCFQLKLAGQEFKINRPHIITKVDSLKEKLRTASGKNRLEIIYQLNLTYRDSLFDVALDYANQYYKLSLTLGDSVNIVKGGRMIAYSLMDMGRNEEAEKLFIKLLDVAQRNEDRYPEFRMHVKSILNNAGIASMTLGNYDRALDYQFQSLKIREEDGDKVQIIRCLNNIGLVFFNLDDYEGAKKYLYRAELLCREINETEERKRVLLNLGLCYTDLGDPKNAIISIEKALSICGTGCSEIVIKECEEGLGFAFSRQKDYTIAKEKFLLSLAIAEKQKDTRYMSENLSHLGLIEIALGNEELGISKLKYSLKLAESAKLTKSKLFTYKELFEVYKKRNDLKNSLFYLEKYDRLKDSVYSSALIKNLTKIQTDFAERENVKVIKAKDQILSLNQKLIQKQKLQTILIAAVAMMLLLLAGVFYKFYRDKLLINVKLDQKVRERTEELRQNNSSLVHTNEMQHSLLQKIGHEGQSIISAFKGLSHIAQLDIADEKVKEYFEKVEVNTEKLAFLFSRIEH